MQKAKRILAICLALCMLLSVLPVTALAVSISPKPANGTTVGQPFAPGTGGSQNFRIPGIVTLNDGTVFDSSYERGEPLEFICGVGMMIRGYDEAVAKMEVGQSIDIHLTPDQAYGYSDPRAIFTVEISQLPGSEELSVGESVVLYTTTGQPMPVKVTARDDTTITFDANHEMAGKELNFHIELVEIQ